MFSAKKPALSAAKIAFAVQKLQSQIELLQSEPIAIIGMSCRFPGGANSPEEFWKILSGGINTVSEVPKQRWSLDKYYDPNPDSLGKMYTKYGSFLTSPLNHFDANFFGISPREAQSLDPHQKLLLEVNWEALENACQAPELLFGSNTGVYVGMGSMDHSTRLFGKLPKQQIDSYFGTGATLSPAAGRLSYILGLTGPSLVVDTACSSSITAIHLACQGLRNRECNLALVSAVNLLLNPELSINFSKAKMLSPDGSCKTFSADANGYVRGEGCGAVVLKRLSEALSDHDPILAIIRGTALNQDGKSGGLTVPSGPSQEQVITKALNQAKVSPEQIAYIEAHGTGTPLGDPIEMKAIGSVFGNSHNKSNPLIVGSVKTNIGHLEAVSGIAGLIKAILILQQKIIPRNLHFNNPNPHINWDEIPITVPVSNIPLDSQHKFIGISSFGFSGTNGHIIIEEPPFLEEEHNPQDRDHHILTLSAKTVSSMEKQVMRYTEFLQKNKEKNLANICFSANSGRSHFEHRLAITGKNVEEIVQNLSIANATECSLKPKIAFLFTGQGSQYPNMGKRFYETETLFREIIDECADILKEYLTESLVEVLYNPALAHLIDETEYTQPALFAFEYALAQLWKSWGIEPDIVMGHSVGEYAAACFAGVFSLEDGLKMMALRAKHMQQTSKGAMLAVFTGKEELISIINNCKHQISIAALNTTTNIVVSGTEEALDELKSLLQQKNITSEKLQVTRAFHSHLMESIREPLQKTFSSIHYAHPTIDIVANVSGGLQQTMDANYWLEHVYESVNFARGMETLHEQKCDIFVEIGPNPILLGMGRRCLPSDYGTWLPSIRKSTSEWEQIIESLKKIYLQGGKVDWSGFDASFQREPLALPTYPFDRQLYEISSENFCEDISYKIDWCEVPFSSEKVESTGTWIIFADQQGVAEKLKQQLEISHKTIMVATQSCGEYLVISPDCKQSFEDLFSKIQPQKISGIIYLWGLDATTTENLDKYSLQESQILTCQSVLLLLQTLIAKNIKLDYGIKFVTSQAVCVDNSENLQLAQSCLWGLAKVISLEHPSYWGGIIDLGNLELLQVDTLANELLNAADFLAIRSKKYIPKLVFVQSHDLLENNVSIEPESTYLITGGLGALGLEILQMLFEEGATHFVIVGRSVASDLAKEIIQKIEGQGGNITIANIDIAKKIELERLLEDIKIKLPPLKGIFHAAGVVDDGILMEQNWEKFTRVLSPKISGAWNLHLLTEGIPLDFFVLFSSVSSVIGLKGQSNYVAANMFLDSLAHYRHIQKLPALSINWGPWNKGMAAKASDEFLRQGVTPIEPKDGTSILKNIMRKDIAQLCIFDVDWNKFLSTFFDKKYPTILENFSGKVQHLKQKQNILEQLRKASWEQSRNIVLDYLQKQINLTLRLAPNFQIKEGQALQEFGLDSLMALELRYSILQDLAVEISVAKLFEMRSLELLAKQILEKITLNTITLSQSLNDDNEDMEEETI